MKDRNNKKISLHILKVFFLAMIVGVICMWSPKSAFADNIATVTITDKSFLGKLEECFNNSKNRGAKVSLQGNEMEINFDKITYLSLSSVSMTEDNAVILKKLLSDSSNLEIVLLKNINLGEYDFSTIDNRNSLKSMYLLTCHMTNVPEITLPNLKILYLTDNEFIEQGACDNFNSSHFPMLEALYLDDCFISDISFLQNMGTNLITLSLARNKLTDASLDFLMGIKDSNLSNLETLNLGGWVNWGIGGGRTNIALPNSNKFKDMEKLASLLNSLPMLKVSDLSRSSITSLQGFAVLRDNDNISIDFSDNYISDFAGLEGKKKFNLENQSITLSDKISVQGDESEMPELLKRILNPDDVLYGTITCNTTGVSLTDDYKIRVDIDCNASSVIVEVGGIPLEDGWTRKTKLIGSEIKIPIKKRPSYTIPTGLTATIGDTLAQVALPKGFEWIDSTLDVGEKGEHIFKAVFTPQDTENYAIINNIDVKVTVEEAPHSHSWDITWSSDAADHWHVCTTCKEKKDISAHSFGEWKIDKEPTEEEMGMKHRECEMCQYREEKSIPQEGHKHQYASEWSSSDTVHYHLCIICENDKKDIEAHVFGEWKIDKEPTEEETGMKHRVCEVCQYREEKSIPQEGHKHQYSSDWENNQTDHWHICLCGEKKDISAHSYGKWITDQEATESEAGRKHRVCVICGYTESEKISPVGKPGGNQGNTEDSSDKLTEEEKDDINNIADKLGVSQVTAKKIQRMAKKFGVEHNTLLVTDEFIMAQKTDKDINGSTFGKLRAKATKTKTKSIKLTWNKVKGADGYIIFGNRCGIGRRYKPMKIIKKGSAKSFTFKKLKKGTFYKYIVRAYRIVDGKRVTIAASKTVHATTNGGKRGNLKTVKLNKKSVKLKKGKTFKIKAKEVKQSKPLAHHRKICFESSNKKVATVSKKGIIKAKGKGSCTIYVYGLNGVYKTIKVNVS